MLRAVLIGEIFVQIFSVNFVILYSIKIRRRAVTISEFQQSPGKSRTVSIHIFYKKLKNVSCEYDSYI